MNICYRCHQPINMGTTILEEALGWRHKNCPYTDSQIIRNLEQAMSRGFKPEFCRTHEIKHKS